MNVILSMDDKLAENVEEFRQNNKSTYTYIICSKESEQLLCTRYKLKTNENNPWIFKGCMILNDSNLKLGEFEIR